MNSEELESLNLSSNKIKNINLSPLKNCQHLTSINLADNLLKKINLKHLPNSIAEIRLDYNQLTKINLEKLSSSELEVLNLSHNQLSEINFLLSKELRYVFKKLIINNNKLTEINLSSIMEFRELKTIKIDSDTHAYVKNYTFGHSVDHPKRTSPVLFKYIESIRADIYDGEEGTYHDIGNINFFEKNFLKFTNLKQLSISDELKKNKFHYLDKLTKLKNLVKLSLDGINSKNKRKIPFLPNITQLEIRFKDDNTSLDLNFISNFPNVESLKLLIRREKNINLEPLTKLLNLSKLSIGGNIFLNNVYFREAEDIDFSPLGKCKNLKCLRIHRVKGSELNLSSLHENCMLRTIVFDDVDIPRLDLSALTSCKELSTIVIRYSYIEKYVREPFREIDLRSLVNFPNLKTLILNDFKFINIDPILELKNLKILQIENCVCMVSTKSEKLLESSQLFKKIIVENNQILTNFEDKQIIHYKSKKSDADHEAAFREAFTILDDLYDRIDSGFKNNEELYLARNFNLTNRKELRDKIQEDFFAFEIVLDEEEKRIKNKKNELSKRYEIDYYQYSEEVEDYSKNLLREADRMKKFLKYSDEEVNEKLEKLLNKTEEIFQKFESLKTQAKER